MMLGLDEIILFLCSVSLSEYTIIRLPVLLMMDTRTISSHWLLRKKLFCTFLYISFGGHTHSFLLGIYLGVKLLGHRIGIYLALENITEEFPKVVSSI